ncbi:MAG: DNA double-strand break repair nuclease NurA [Chloroflexi bacterium]|nr:DNA double-strand break repair nuclease NurA [Chloroflexota bacterium]
MAFDVRALSSQIASMAVYLAHQEPDRQQRRQAAMRAWEATSDEWQKASSTIEQSSLGFITALPLEDPRLSFPPSSVPAEYHVVATDGSQIEPERHGIAPYIVLNVGWAHLRYGSTSEARFGSEPTVRYRTEDLEFTLEGRRVPIQEELLATLRTAFERRKLADLLENLDTSVPCLGLVDGSLLDLNLSNRREEIPEALIEDLHTQLSRIRCSGHVLVGYISRPASREVVNFARWSECSDRPVMACRRCSSLQRYGQRACGALDGFLDADLLLPRLPLYHRSTIFRSLQRVQQYYGEHRIYCFYLNVGTELARVEIPEWVALDSARLALVHALVADQCRRGSYRQRVLGYPPALIEAHEQAVVSAEDRRLFAALLERQMTQAGLHLVTSAKALSKQWRAI